MQGCPEDVREKGGRQRDTGAVYVLWLELQSLRRAEHGLGRIKTRGGEQEDVDRVEHAEDRVGEA